MARCFHGDAKIVEEHLSQKYIEWSHDNQYIVPMYKNGLLVDYNLDEISEMIDKERIASLKIVYDLFYFRQNSVILDVYIAMKDLDEKR